MATNKLQAGGEQVLTIRTAATDPAAPISGDPVLVGQLPGVALTDEDSTDGKTTIDIGVSIFDLSVKAVNASGNSAVAVGDRIYYVTGDTPKLSKKATGVYFGIVLEAVTAGATDTIEVLVGR